MEWETISIYTRQQALEDGVLIDVSDMAREASIRYPVAVTSRLWNEFIVPLEVDEHAGQSTNGRLWDVLYLFAIYARQCRGNWMNYRVGFVVNGKNVVQPIKSVIGPGDHFEPVITLMLPDEE